MQININRGTYTGDCVDESDLMANQAKYPAIRAMLEYTDQRMVSSLLVNGAVGPYGVKDVPNSKLPSLDDAKMLADNSYRFNVMGRIQGPSIILSQVGATSADGTFQLIMGDSTLVPGMVVTFADSGRFQARVMGFPVGTPGNMLYTFQSPNREIFDWATVVAPQAGVKTCFGGHTSYEEGSERGYGKSKFYDTYIQHTTIQRKTCAITGTAASDVLWMEIEGEGIKGWVFEQLQQSRAQFQIEREYQRWFGISTMKAADGSLLPQSNLFENGMPIIAGDGVEEQIMGQNEIYGSGTGGSATRNDIRDLLKSMRKKSDRISGLQYVFVTGEDGMSNMQDVMTATNTAQNIQLFKNINDTDAAGGATPDAGVTYAKMNIDGDTVYFMKHPMFDDDQRFPAKGNDGRSLMSSTYFGFTIGTGQNKNMDVFTKGGKNGYNRAFVTQDFNGMTGGPGNIVSESDSRKYAMLTEDMLVIYNTAKCGIIRKGS